MDRQEMRNIILSGILAKLEGGSLNGAAKESLSIDQYEVFVEEELLLAHQLRKRFYKPRTQKESRK